MVDGRNQQLVLITAVFTIRAAITENYSTSFDQPDVNSEFNHVLVEIILHNVSLL